jgi:hypothetical protein
MGQAYHNECIILTTKHSKSVGIAPIFWETLKASVLECVVDTDTLGTFCGEVERKDNQIEVARKKCEWGMKVSNAEYGLASEGSLGPHPFLPFVASNYEVLYFIDKKRDFHLNITTSSLETNYQMSEISSLTELLNFAVRCRFPSHALILRPDGQSNKCNILKGIDELEDLKAAYHQSLSLSKSGKVWAETDMRAHLNPTRMTVIENLAKKLALRLNCLCPKCKTPGWGMVDIERGLECSLCGEETQEIKSEIFGCTKCDYQEYKVPSERKEKSDPIYCSFCNP